MKDFIRLFTELDETNKTNSKISALVSYFELAEPNDAIWTIRFLVGKRPGSIIKTSKLRKWSAELADMPDWLFDECYEIVGDLAETISLILPKNSNSNNEGLAHWVENRLLPMRGLDEKEQKDEIIKAWNELGKQGRFVLNKILTGGFRVGVSKKIVINAISKYLGVDSSVIAHRLMGNWSPTAEFYNELTSENTSDTDISRPYPFYLANKLEGKPKELGTPDDWLIEWKWDGIRSQLIKRKGNVFIWSRGEEMVNDTFPEIALNASKLPDGTVIDGELLAWKDGMPMKFGELQRRIGRKNVSKKMLKEIPVVIMAFDLLESKGKDLRNEPIEIRKLKLKELTHDGDLLIFSGEVKADTWEELAEIRESSRDRCVEGFMLKRMGSEYKVGRTKGDWWKWKIDPLTIDAVLLYSQRGHGRRSGLYTDHTFAVWKDGQLIPFTKAYSGLTDKEIAKVDKFIKQNTLERFGPVRSVAPELVFEIAFEGIRESGRHKSGIAVRFPRIHRWRKDKKPEEANTLNDLKSLV